MIVAQIKPQAALLIFLSAVVTLIFCSYIYRIDSPEARYKDYPTHFQYIYNHSGPLDVAAMGGSRTLRVVNGPVLAKLMTDHLDKEIIVYDMARSGRGMETNYVILRDLLEQRPVKILLVEYNDTLPNNVVHPNFFRLARFSDLFEDVATYPGGIWDGLKRTGSQLDKKIGDHLQFVVRRYPNKINEQKVDSKTSDTSLPTTVRPWQLSPRMTLKDTWRDQPERTWGFFSPLEYHQSTYIKKLIAMAAKKQTKVIFFHIPAIYWPVFSDEFVQRFEQTFGAPLWQPGKKLLDEIYAHGHADHSHVRIHGSQLYMEWLASNLAKEFSDVH